jgi:nitroreductase
MGATTDSLEVEIVQTRAEMEETLDAIKEKLDPQYLKQQAKEAVREATVGRVQEAVSTGIGKAQEAVSAATDKAREAVSASVDQAQEVMSAAVDRAQEAVAPAMDSARYLGSRVVRTIRANAVLAAAVGVGIGWLWYSAFSRPRSWQ